MKLKNVHPGEILQKDFIEPLEISLSHLSQFTRINEVKLRSIIQEKEPITFNVAHGLSLYFGNYTDFWLNAQKTYDHNRSKSNGRTMG